MPNDPKTTTGVSANPQTLVALTALEREGFSAMDAHAAVRALQAVGLLVWDQTAKSLPPLLPIIPWIKAYRALHGCGLKEAKDAHDALSATFTRR